jgi:nicotinamide mononucleotide adenylyltransferase
VIVGIGSSQESGTENNPWDFEMRKKMVESLDLRGSSLKVVAISDMYDDKKWGELIREIVKQAGCEPSDVVGVGNNEWTNRILKQVGVEVFETGLYNRDELEGMKIRTLMREGDMSWKTRVPETVVKCLEEYDKSK